MKEKLRLGWLPRLAEQAGLAELQKLYPIEART